MQAIPSLSFFLNYITIMAKETKRAAVSMTTEFKTFAELVCTCSQVLHCNLSETVENILHFLHTGVA
jgi:hypothetical protein